MSLTEDQEYVPEYRGKLQPCPFCGSQDVDPEGWLSNGGKKGPACDDCGGSADSVERWNTRPLTTPSPQPSGQIAEIRARHEATERAALRDCGAPRYNLFDLRQAHTDRATLLSILDSRRGVVDKEALAEWLANKYAKGWQAFNWDDQREDGLRGIWRKDANALLASGIIGAVPSEEEMARLIMVQIQGNDFGHWRDDETFVTTHEQLDALDKACKEAARALRKAMV